MCYVAPVALRLTDVFQWRSDSEEPESMCDRLEWRVRRRARTPPCRTARAPCIAPPPHCPTACANCPHSPRRTPPRLSTFSSLTHGRRRASQVLDSRQQGGWRESWAVLVLGEATDGSDSTLWRLALFSTLQVRPASERPRHSLHHSV